MTKPDERDFEAIDRSAKSGGSIPPDKNAKKERDAFFSDEPGKISQENRYMRRFAFGAFGLVCLAYFVFLLCILKGFYYGDSSTVKVLLAEQANWHTLIFLGVITAIFAAIPLSLTMALVKMISAPGGEDNNTKIPLITPQVELLRTISDLSKTCHDLAKTIK